MTRRKKSGFFTFCFSFLPGAGEMYLGFMKMGISLMGLFFGIFAFGTILNLQAVLFINAVLWFYSFFHVHNLAGLSEMELTNMKDDYLFNLDSFFNIDRKSVHKYRKVIAAILILLGVVLVWNGIMDICYAYLPEVIVRVFRRIGYTIPRIVAGIAIIAGGFYMIKGKKEELKEIIIDAAPEEEENMDAAVTAERNAYGTEADNQDA